VRGGSKDRHASPSTFDNDNYERYATNDQQADLLGLLDLLFGSSVNQDVLIVLPLIPWLGDVPMLRGFVHSPHLTGDTYEFRMSSKEVSSIH
jgi:hypothetical protein